jgi:copper transport protein
VLVSRLAPSALILLILFHSITLSKFPSISIYSDALATDNLEANSDPLDRLKVDIKQFPIPTRPSWPLYPLFDHNRNVIWVGDTVIDSGRIWEFDIATKMYKEHKLNNTSIVTASVLDSNNTIWYLDPLLKRIGYYSPSIYASNKVFDIQTNDTIFGMAIDDKGIIWMTSPNDSLILRFDTNAKIFKPVIQLPFPESRPLGIEFDKKRNLWIADELGSIISISSIDTDTIYRYSPPNSQEDLLASPTAILLIPYLNSIFVSNHNDKSVTSFNMKNKEFRIYELPTLGLPFGMALGKLGHIWVVQHTSNQSFVLDPSTGNSREFIIPHPNPYVQWVTSDSNGDIWLAEQLAGSLGKLVVN